MKVTPLRASDYRSMPWKNGLGITREVWREPREGELAWRVSIADVATDGPFSGFTGCDRIILTLEGAGMDLRHVEPRLSASIGLLEPWRFSGDWTTECVLRDGPIRDFNVIARRDACAVALEVLRFRSAAACDVADVATLVYCVAGEFAVRDQRIAKGETLLIEATGNDRALALKTHADCVAIKVDISNA